MKGSYLNSERWDFISSTRRLLKEIGERIEQTDYYRFDEWDEYREDYFLEFMAKTAQAKIALHQILELLDE